MKHEVFVLGGQRIDQKSTLRKGAIVSSSPQGMTNWSSTIKLGFFKLIECIIKMPWCETECKNMCHSLVNRM